MRRLVPNARCVETSEEMSILLKKMSSIGTRIIPPPTPKNPARKPATPPASKRRIRLVGSGIHRHDGHTGRPPLSFDLARIERGILCDGHSRFKLLVVLQ